MSDTNGSSTLRTYDSKVARARRGLAKRFIAYVRGRRRRGTMGFIVFASDQKLGQWKHENLTAFFVSHRPEQLRHADAILDEVRQQFRKLYLDENFHGTTAADMLGAVSRYMLGDWREPEGLEVCALILDVSDSVITVDFRGGVHRQPGDGRQRMTLVGCEDAATARLVRGAIRRHLITGHATPGSQKALARELRKLTGMRETGCIRIST